MSAEISVVLIDNEDATGLVPPTCTVSWFTPDALATEAVEQAIRASDLLLVDHELNLPEVLGPSVLDGASMVGVLRSWARRKAMSLPPLVLITNDDEAFSGEVPAVGPDVALEGSFVGAEHRVAPVLDAEWMLFKQDRNVRTKIGSLAADFHQIRNTVGEDGISFDEICTLLALPPDAAWRPAALEQLRRARPPVSQTPEHRDGGARGPALLVRWLLHHALSFPGIFLGEVFVAWSLNVTLASFRAFLEDAAAADTDLRRRLDAARYRGRLSGVIDSRWWRPAVDDIVLGIVKTADELGGFPAALDRLAGPERLKPGIRDSVVVYDYRFLPAEIAPIEKAIELHVPNWPAEAMAPFALVDEVERDPVLRVLADLPNSEPRAE